MQRIFLSVVLLCFAGSPAFAGGPIPSPTASSVDPVIVGGPGGFLFPSAVPGDAPGFTVRVRDAGGNPIPGAFVQIWFHQAPGTRLYNTQNVGMVWGCPTPTVGQVADANGVVNLGIRLAGFSFDQAVSVYANNVQLRWVNACTTDLNATGGVCDAADAAIFRAAFYSGLYRAEIDYNLNGAIDVGDVNIFRTELFAGTPVEPYCP